MKAQEDKWIREKLDELNGLPEGYHPNLDSKWSVVEASLNGDKKRTVFFWRRIASAAILLLIGGSGLLLMLVKTQSQQKPKRVMETKPVIQRMIATEQNQPAEGSMKNGIHRLPPTKQKLNPNPEPLLITKKSESPVTDSMLNPVSIPGEQIAIAKSGKAKKPRYVEVDFNDEALANNKNTEPVVAAQFTFKVNLGPQPRSSTGNFPKLAKSF